MAKSHEIAARREHYVKQGYPTFPVKFHGAEFDCFVLPQKLCTDLPNFAMQMVSDEHDRLTVLQNPNELALFGVCDTVKPRYRPFAMVHEMSEYVDGMTCLQATLEELASAWAELRAHGAYYEHIEARVRLFEPLIPYATAQKYPAAKVLEFQASLDLFHHLVNIRR